MKNNEKTGRSVEQHWHKKLAQQGQKRGRDRFKQRKKREMKKICERRERLNRECGMNARSRGRLVDQH